MNSSRPRLFRCGIFCLQLLHLWSYGIYHHLHKLKNMYPTIYLPRTQLFGPFYTTHLSVKCLVLKEVCKTSLTHPPLPPSSSSQHMIYSTFHSKLWILSVKSKFNSGPTMSVVNMLVGFSFPGGWLAWRWSIVGGCFDVFCFIIFLLNILLVLRASKIHHAVGQRRRTWRGQKEGHKQGPESPPLPEPTSSGKSLSGVWLFVTSRTVQSMEFSRPEYWIG